MVGLVARRGIGRIAASLDHLDQPLDRVGAVALLACGSAAR